MQLCRFIIPTSNVEPRFGLINGKRIYDLSSSGVTSFQQFLSMPLDQAHKFIDGLDVSTMSVYDANETTLVAPIDAQEVWAAGVTYIRSREARVEEAETKDVYQRVYEAQRPELFFKANPRRVVGPGKPIVIRKDSTWDVPEPELALVLNTHMELVGYTVGDDVSSRSIEGENPLYLPQAKVYNDCCALGPAITFVWDVPDPKKLNITLRIFRNGKQAYEGSTDVSQIHRTFDDLSEYLGRDQTFPDGVFLLTGTGIVPPSDFTLKQGDEVEITIDQIGTLRNPVRQGYQKEA